MTVSQKIVTKTSFVTLFVTNDKITVTKIIDTKISLPKFTNSHGFKINLSLKYPLINPFGDG